MTLQECKDQIAIQCGFHNWKHMDQNSTMTESQTVHDRVSELYAQQRVQEYRRKTADIMEDTLTIDINKVVGKSRDRSIGYNNAIEFFVKSLRELPEPLPKAPTV